MGPWCALQEFPWYFWRAAVRWKAVFATVWGSALSDDFATTGKMKNASDKKKSKKTIRFKKK